MAPEADSISDWLDDGPTDPEVVAGRYDQWAQSYDDDLASWSYQAPAVVAATVAARHPAAASLLDVGCGTGLVGRALRAGGYDGRLDGLDLSEASLELARATDVYGSLRQADLQQPLPVADDEYDAVVCVGVMTYLPEVEAVWRELARVTRPGGIVVLTQREDLWDERACPAVIERLTADGVWVQEDVSGPAPYLPDGYGGTPEVSCYYLTARVS